MDRTQKKCVIASAGFHLLLLVILFFGSAFFSGTPKQPQIQELEFIPINLNADGPQGGGNPSAGSPVARPPAPTPPTPAPHQTPPAPAPEKPAAREVVKESTPVKSSSESYEVSKKRLSAENLKMVTRKNTTKSTSKKASSESDNEERKMADARRQAGELISQTATGMRRGMSSATTIRDGDVGPGGGGPSYASYASWVQKIYLDAWAAPEDSASQSAVAEVSVTIASDGSVISSKFLNRSGDTQVDASVQRVLNRVTTMGRPFPDGMKEKHRTYILQFDLKIKRGMA